MKWYKIHSEVIFVSMEKSFWVYMLGQSTLGEKSFQIDLGLLQIWELIVVKADRRYLPEILQIRGICPDKFLAPHGGVNHHDNPSQLWDIWQGIGGGYHGVNFIRFSWTCHN